MKKCSRCKQIQGLENFCKNKCKKDGLDYYCKKCNNEREKKYRLENREKIREKSKKYNNSTERIDIRSNLYYQVSISDMLEWQNNKCAICQEVENGKKLAIDHNHETGLVRMLLCYGCNTGHKLTDNIKLLKAKIEYLETYE